MDAINSQRGAFQWAQELMEMVMADVTEEQLNWKPPGVANPIRALYAHAICSADVVIHTFIQGQAPLFESNWLGKTGVSQPQLGMSPEWARTVDVDLSQMRPYAQAVYAAIDAYIASLKAQDLDREHDLSQVGFGAKTVDWMLSALVTSHLNNMAGEISCLKGLQGAKGYPF